MTIYRAPHNKRPIFVIATTFIVTLVLILLLIGLSFPTILSTGWGQGRLIHYANERLPGQVQMGNLHLSWLGDQQVQDLVYQEPSGKVLRIGSLTSKTSLLSMLWNQGKTMQAEVRDLNLEIGQKGIALNNVQGNLQRGPQGLQFHLNGETRQDTLKGSFILDALLQGAKPQKVAVQVVNFPVDIAAQIIATRDPKLGMEIRSFLGPVIDMQVDQVQAVEGMQLNFSAKTPTLQATGKGLLKAEIFALAEPGQVTLRLTPTEGDNLIGPTVIQLAIDKLQIPLSGDLHQAHAIVKVDHPMQVGGLTVQDVQMELQKGLNLTLAAAVKPSQIDNHAQVTLSVKGAQWSELLGKGTLQIDKLRIKQFGANNLVIPWSIDGTRGIIAFNLSAKTDPSGTLKGQGELTQWIKDGVIDFSNAQYNLSGDLNKVSLALVSKLLDQPALDALGENVDVSLTAQGALRGNGKLQFTARGTDLTANADLHLTAEQLHFDFSGNQRKSEFKASGTVQNPLKTKFSLKDLSFNVQADVKQLPAELLCKIACLESATRVKVEALVGTFVDAQLTAQLNKMTGPFQAQLQGDLGKVDVAGKVAGGVLTLNKPFYAEVTASPELGESVLRDVLPILGGMQHSDERLSVTIDPEGFSMPIRNPDLSNIEIGKMNVQLGHLSFNNEGQLGKILDLLKARGHDTIQVWFTPIYVSLSKGVIHIQRFDLLALDRFPLASWGSVNIPGDRMNMVLGLSGQSLQSAFGIRIANKDYMMQFPLHGPLGSAGFDKAHAAAKIAALTAETVAGGPQGKVLGTVIGIASGTILEHSPPAPTTNPLPWAAHSTADGSDSDSPATEGKKEVNPLKFFEKGLKKILKNI